MVDNMGHLSLNLSMTYLRVSSLRLEVIKLQTTTCESHKKKGVHAR